MTRPTKITALLAAVLLISGAGIYILTGVAEGLGEDEVEWTDAAGNAITHVKPSGSSPAVFYIQDGALAFTKAGRRIFGGVSGAVGGATFSIPAGTITGAVVATTSLEVVDYNIADPAATPLSGAPTVTVGTSQLAVASFDPNAGTFTVIVNIADGANVTANFDYHFQDVYSGSTAKRAEVVSTSDPQGEAVTIAEVAGLGSTVPAANSTIFRGEVFLSDNPADQGSGDGKVWVQDGDTVTVRYVDSSGAVINLDTVTVDAVAPIIANVIPADGTITNVSQPRVEFEVTDLAAGVDRTTIAVTINGVPVPATDLATQTIQNGFRVVFAQAESWTESACCGGFNVVDSVAFTMTVGASDKSGNQASASVVLTIDGTSPTLSGASTGPARNAVTARFSEALDAASVAASDFTVTDAVVSSVSVNPESTEGHRWTA